MTEMAESESFMHNNREIVVWRYEDDDFYYQVALTPGGGNTAYGQPQGPYYSMDAAIEAAKADN